METWKTAEHKYKRSRGKLQRKNLRKSGENLASVPADLVRGTHRRNCRNRRLYYYRQCRNLHCCRDRETQEPVYKERETKHYYPEKKKEHILGISGPKGNTGGKSPRKWRRSTEARQGVSYVKLPCREYQGCLLDDLFPRESKICLGDVLLYPSASRDRDDGVGIRVPNGDVGVAVPPFVGDTFGECSERLAE